MNFAALDDVVGPRFISEQRSVMARDIVSISKLLEILMNMGCENCMIYPSQFEAATSQFLSEVPLRSDKIQCDTYAHKFSEHTRLVFNMVRLLVREDEPGHGGHRSRCTKTGYLRKTSSTSEWTVVRGLMAKVLFVFDTIMGATEKLD